MRLNVAASPAGVLRAFAARSTVDRLPRRREQFGAALLVSGAETDYIARIDLAFRKLFPRLRA
jgi:hypothetical protein